MQKELRLKKRVLKVYDYDDKELELRFPTSLELEDYLTKVQKIMEGEDTTPEVKYAREFLIKVGAGQKFLDELQNEDIVEIMMILCGLKKS